MQMYAIRGYSNKHKLILYKFMTVITNQNKKQWILIR